MLWHTFLLDFVLVDFGYCCFGSTPRARSVGILQCLRIYFMVLIRAGCGYAFPCCVATTTAGRATSAAVATAATARTAASAEAVAHATAASSWQEGE